MGAWGEEKRNSEIARRAEKSRSADLFELSRKKSGMKGLTGGKLKNVWKR